MTVCMGYPAMTPKWESRKTPLEGGRKSMQGERQDVDFPVAEKNDVLKMTTFSYRNANERTEYRRPALSPCGNGKIYTVCGDSAEGPAFLWREAERI